MPNPWSPHAIRDPGDSAGYAFGRNENRVCCVHCTAGRNSYGLVKHGRDKVAPASLSFQLYPKVGMPWQFCEIDALTHDSPPNRDGPGFEVERMSAGSAVRPGLSGWEDLTPDQLHYLQLNIRWMHDEWGYPLDLYNGPRTHGVGVPGFRGFANHGDIDNQRSDGVTREEWDAITADTADDDEEPTRHGEEEDEMYISPEGNPNDLWVSNSIHRRQVSPKEWERVRNLARFFKQPEPPIWPLDVETFNSIPVAK